MSLSRSLSLLSMLQEQGQVRPPPSLSLSLWLWLLCDSGELSSAQVESSYNQHPRVLCPRGRPWCDLLSEIGEADATG